MLTSLHVSVDLIPVPRGANFIVSVLQMRTLGLRAVKSPAQDHSQINDAGI